MSRIPGPDDGVINLVLQVHLKEENKYMLFYQKKYGLSQPAYATVGGLFNEGESAFQCATRELLEETGLVAADLVSLGQYRVQVLGQRLHATAFSANRMACEL